MYFNKTAQSYFKRYKFPLKVGEYWIGNQPLDTSKVIGKSNISVIAGTFANSYIIERKIQYIPNGSLYEKEFFLPNTGLITRVHHEIGGGYFSQYWELVDYSIK